MFLHTYDEHETRVLLYLQRNNRIAAGMIPNYGY